MLTLTFLIKTLIDFYIMILLLRIWMRWANCDFYNPFSQFISKITHTIISPFRRIITERGSLDNASLFLAFVLATIKLPILTFIKIHIVVFNYIYLLMGLLVLLKAIGELIFWVIITRSILSWISQGRSPIDIVIYQLSEPLIHYIRCILPTVGGIDFSIMIIIIILYALNYLGMDLFPEIWYRL